MTLYNSALAPAVKGKAGSTVDELATVDVGETINQTTVNAALALIVNKLNALIVHMNDGRADVENIHDKPA
jgi:hypothetical protein